MRNSSECRHITMTSYRFEDPESGDLTNSGIVCHECRDEIPLDKFVDLKIERAFVKFKEELLAELEKMLK